VLPRRSIISLAITIAVLLAGAPGARAARGGASARALPADEVQLSLSASPVPAVSGRRVMLSGQAAGAAAGAVVGLFASPYPYGQPTPVQTATVGADGSFSFTVFPDRDTRYDASIAGTATSPTLQVDVIGEAQRVVKALTLGRARVTIVVFHPGDLKWGGATVSWSFASGRGAFAPAPSTRAFPLGPHVVVLKAIVALPAGPFRWRACFHAPGVDALQNPDRPPGCTGRGYHGTGSLPAGFPGPAAVARAERRLAARQGRTAFAVIDTEGRLAGVHVHSTFITASVVKAMLLVAYLRRLDAIGPHHVDSVSNSILYPMINVSDNTAASECWSIVGNSGLYSVAAAAGMNEFSVTTDWGSAMISPADQARFFFEMDSLIPPEFVGYARRLLSTIAGYESWGIPAIARPLGYTVFFKGGWRPTPDIYLVNQIARLEGHGRAFSIAVMTDGDPDMGYGIDTIQGVATALLG